MNVTKGERARFRRHREGLPSTIQGQQPPVTTRSRQEHLARDAHDSSEEDAQESVTNESVWFDGPLALTLLPPLGSFLTGGDFVRDGLIIALLFYYLRALIKTPWELYLKARAHRSPTFDFESEQNVPEEPEHVTNLRAMARSELRLAELSFLVLCLLTPFLGTILLRYAAFLIGSESLSWFSQGLFVLATGVRPWRHLINLLAYRTDSLHRIVHAPLPPSATSTSSSNARFDQLERSLEEIHASKSSNSTEFQTLMEHVEASIQKLEVQTTASSRATELVRLDLDSRFHDVQTSVEALVHDIGTLEQRVEAATAAAASANVKLANTTDFKPHSAAWNGTLSPLAPSGTLADHPRELAKSLSERNASPPFRRHKNRPSQDAAATFVLENIQNGSWPQFQERIVHLVVDAVLLPVKLSQSLLHALLGLLGLAGSHAPTKGVKMVTAPTPSAKT